MRSLHLRRRTVAVLTFIAGSVIRRAAAGLIAGAAVAYFGHDLSSDTVDSALVIATSVGLALLHAPQVSE